MRRGSLCADDLLHCGEARLAHQRLLGSLGISQRHGVHVERAGSKRRRALPQHLLQKIFIRILHNVVVAPYQCQRRAVGIEYVADLVNDVTRREESVELLLRASCQCSVRRADYDLARRLGAGIVVIDDKPCARRIEVSIHELRILKIPCIRRLYDTRKPRGITRTFGPSVIHEAGAEHRTRNCQHRRKYQYFFHHNLPLASHGEALKLSYEISI